MINALWLNAQGLSGDGTLQRIVPFAANGHAAVAAQATFTRQRGLHGIGGAGAATAITVTRRRQAAGDAFASVTGEVGMAPARNMAAHAYVLTDSFLGGSLDVHFAADAKGGAAGILYPYDKLFAGVAQAGATAHAGLTRRRRMAGTASLSAVVPQAPTDVGRLAYANAHVLTGAIGSPDATVAGGRIAGFGAIVAAGAAAQCTIDPKKPLYAAASIGASAYAAPVVNRIVSLECNPQLAGARVAFPALHATVALAAQAASAGAHGVAPLYRTTRLRGASTTAIRPLIRPRLAASRLMRASGRGGIAVTADVHRRKGLAANVRTGASAQPAAARLAQRLYGDGQISVSPAPLAGAYFTMFQFTADGTMGATVETVRLSQRHMLGAAAAAGATASATLFVNLCQRAPDFRTLVLEPEDRTDALEPEDRTLAITDASDAMKTFTKQPADVLDYDFDFTEWFAQTPQDDIETATCVVTSATDGVTDSLSVNVAMFRAVETDPAKIVKVWLSAGLNGVTYKLTLTVTTEDGRTKEVDFKLKTKEV